ncbi:MAG: hypothetical protein HY721_31345, partial [Planctomycetes bacterium]|nr:hypothetical protein [Planctomycetota bacterium]
IKKYRLRAEGERLGADLVFGVGARDGSPPLPNVESIAADHALDRLHLAGDEGGDFNRVFRLDVTYAGIAYGDPQFEFDQEGINLYDLGGKRGYLLVSDQHTDGTPNEFELFDRATLAPLGNFTSPPGGSIVTTNTDGPYLEQRPIAGFPDGAFYAVNDDVNAHAYDWTDIAQAKGLEVAALDRPFSGRAAASGSPGPARRALWFHDGSWWGALPRGPSLTVSRLEDGTFAAMDAYGTANPAVAWARGGDLALLSLGSRALFVRFEYRPELRRYVPLTEGFELPARGSLADLLVEEAADGSPVRGWIAWVEGGEARVTWSGASLVGWDLNGAALGEASSAVPRLARAGAATALAWAGPGGVLVRLHADGDPPAVWAPAEAVTSSAASSPAALRPPTPARPAARTRRRTRSAARRAAGRGEGGP